MRDIIFMIATYTLMGIALLGLMILMVVGI